MRVDQSIIKTAAMSKIKTVKKKSRKLTISSITKLSKDILNTDYQDLSKHVLEQVSACPQLDLFPERRILLDVIKSEKWESFVRLVEGLSCYYSQLYSACKGKDAYLDFQIRWHESIRSLAAYAEVQCLEYAQIEVCSVPGSEEWLSMVTAAGNISKDNQFAMIHEIARFVYLRQHAETLESSTSMASEERSVSIPPVDVQTNPLGPLIRMCGSQLQ